MNNWKTLYIKVTFLNNGHILLLPWVTFIDRFEWMSFSGFMGNESERGTNKSSKNREAVHTICLSCTSIHSPMNPEKRHSFLKLMVLKWNSSVQWFLIPNVYIDVNLSVVWKPGNDEVVGRHLAERGVRILCWIPWIGSCRTRVVHGKWWDDIWLNEGFASYVEYLGSGHVEPQWHMVSGGTTFGWTRGSRRMLKTLDRVM